jgi:hypothetical protein
MLGWLKTIFFFLQGAWKLVPPETQEEIKEKIINFFVDMFRAYYKSEKEKGEDK